MTLRRVLEGIATGAALSVLCGFPLAAGEGDGAANDDQYRRIPETGALSGHGDIEVLIREHLYPPGWRAPTHYHNGDLFIYVVSGAFEVVTDAGGRVVYGSGQAFQMQAETTMDARNASDAEPVKLVISQIGKPGDPFLVKVE